MHELKTPIQLAELRALQRLRWLPSVRLEILRRHMRVMNVSKDEVLYHPGQPAKHLYCVLQGTIGLSLFANAGRVLQLALLTRGQFFGETALVRGWRRVSQAVALQDSRVGRIEAEALVTEVCGLPWEIFAGLTETVLKPLFLLSLRRSLFLLEELPDRVALALWEYAGHPEAQQLRGAAALDSDSRADCCGGGCFAPASVARAQTARARGDIRSRGETDPGS